MLLEHIKDPSDLRRMTYRQLDMLAGEIRSFIIEKTSHTGGHLASNLGVVELTIALFRVLDMPKDKIIWDVGHQSYTHKILSGRREEFDSLRKMGSRDFLKGMKVLLMPLILDTVQPPSRQGSAWPRAGTYSERTIMWYP